MNSGILETKKNDAFDHLTWELTSVFIQKKFRTWAQVKYPTPLKKEKEKKEKEKKRKKMKERKKEKKKNLKKNKGSRILYLGQNLYIPSVADK